MFATGYMRGRLHGRSSGFSLANRSQLGSCGRRLVRSPRFERGSEWLSTIQVCQFPSAARRKDEGGASRLPESGGALSRNAKRRNGSRLGRSRPFFGGSTRRLVRRRLPACPRAGGGGTGRQRKRPWLPFLECGGSLVTRIFEAIFDSCRSATSFESIAVCVPRRFAASPAGKCDTPHVFRLPATRRTQKMPAAHRHLTRLRSRARS